MLTDLWLVSGTILLIILLILSAFFSGAEIALISLSRVTIKRRVEEGEEAARIVERLLESPDRLLATILVGNNVVNVCASIIAGTLAVQLFGSFGVGIAVFTMTLIILIFCEIIPKAFSIKNEKVAFKVARYICALVKVLAPIVSVLTALSSLVIRALGKERKHQRTFITEDEIKTLLRIGEEEGTIEEDERKMIAEVFEFDETRTKEVMVPRDSMVCVKENQRLGDIVSLINQTGFSRFPVYRRDLDNIIGMVHAKDVLRYQGKNIRARKIMRPILKVSYKQNIDELLRKMQREKTHLAIVMSDDDKTIGLVSLEDLVEELVGEIVDEHDKR